MQCAVIGKGKGTHIAVCEGIFLLQEITCRMGSHSVTCSGDFPAFTPAEADT